MTEVTTERFITEERGGGVHDATVMEQHIAPPGGEEDPFYEQDKLLMRLVRTYLMTRFPVGYEWCVRSDIAQGVVLISIPVLMGVCHWHAINLKTHPDTATAVLHGAGELLERYKLSRSVFDQAAFLTAREQHSKLVRPNREIPS